MRKSLFLLLILFPAITWSQDKRTFFKLDDDSLSVGAVYSTCEILFDLDGHGRLREESLPCLDSLAQFMKIHPEIIFEIGSYTDQRGSDTANMKLSQARADILKQCLIDRGVSSNCLAAVGYGEQFPVIPQSQIDTARTNDSKENLYRKNRRTEFKIIFIYPGIFSLTDTSFYVGQTLRHDIYFDLAKATLRPESRIYLDTIAQFLITHPDLVIEVSNHSDTRVSDKMSSRPTSARSQSVCDYLISKGVPAAQIVARGYHDTSPIVNDKYISRVKSKGGLEQLHQLNRRTEFRIIGIH